MDRRSDDMARTLRDYPISLRQSARAVFGNLYEDAEKQAQGSGKDGDAPLRPQG